VGGCEGRAGPAPEYPPIPVTSLATPAPVGPTPEREPHRDAPRLVEQPSHSPIVTIRVVFEAASADDPRGSEGVTNLAAKWIVGGGAGELPYAQIAERLDPMAGRIESRVGRDQTVFLGRVHRDHLEPFSEMFRDILPFSKPRAGAWDWPSTTCSMGGMSLRSNGFATPGERSHPSG
jgi:zinc protease